MQHKLVAVMMIAGLVAGSTPAQEPERRAASPAPELELVLPESGTVTVPFEIVNRHVLIPVSVGGSEPLRVILDTGAPGPGLVLNRSPRVDALDLPFDPDMRAAIGGVGGDGEPYFADVSLGQEIRLGDLKIGGIHVVVLPPIPGFGGYHDGIIGGTLFQNFVVALDYDRMQLSVHDPARFTPPAGAIELPFTQRRGIPFVNGSVTALDGTSFEVDLVVDIGASHALSLNTDSSDTIKIPAGAIESQLGRGLGGPVLGHVGRVRSFTLAGRTFENVVTSFPESDHQSPRGMDSRNGNLGNGIFSRFNVFFDYARDRFLLVPNRAIDEPFEFDLSGIRFVDDTFQVEKVLPDSPAREAGLRPGDVVTAVDGRPAEDVGFWELREMLRHGPGRDVTFEVRRGGEALKIGLTLRRLV